MDRRLSTGNPPASGPAAPVEDFLDHITAPLVGVMPYPERQELRAEMREHLTSLIEEREAAGLDPVRAMAGAFQEFGEPWRTGEALLREMGAAPGRRPAGDYWMPALAWLGLATGASLLVLEQWVTRPECAYLAPVFAALALGGPVAAGILTAVSAPHNAVSSFLQAFAVTGSVSLGAALLMLPHRQGFWFLLFQLLYWLPLGWLSVTATLSTRLQRCRNRFLQLWCPPAREKREAQ